MADRIAAFVPMKGHSERVPRKNVRSLAGRPLYHWIVDALGRVEQVTSIVIDTDSEAIATDVEKHFPAVEIVWRPEELRGDFVPMHDILRHDATQVDEDLLMQTHSTNPLLHPRTIASAIDAFQSADGHDSLFTVTAWQTRFYWADGQPVNHDPAELIRTQDLPPLYEENSCLYLFKREVIESIGLRIGTTPLLHPVPREEAVDIDDEFDFLVADFLLRRRLEQEA